MSTPSSALGGLLWPLDLAPQPFEPRPESVIERGPVQARRTFAAFDALRGPIDDVVAVTADLLHHGARLIVLGRGTNQPVAALLAAEINRRAFRWSAALRLRVPAIAANDGHGWLAGGGRRGDIAWWVASDGDRVSLLRAVSAAHGIGMANVAIVGGSGGALRGLTDICLCVPNDNPTRMREAQLRVGHALVRQIDAVLRATPSTT